MSKGFFDPQEPFVQFKAKLQDVAREMSKIADSTLQIEQKVWAATQKTHGNQSRLYSGWHQTGWGVGSELALAVKFGVDPWQFCTVHTKKFATVSSQVTTEESK